MMLSLLRFAGYQWSHNPLNIKTGYSRSMYSTIMVSSGEQIDSVCDRLVYIEGKGELVGKDCIEQYKKIRKLFFEKKKGVLTLPGLPSFVAYFTKLSVEGQPTPDVLVYSFEFVQAKKEGEISPSEYVCKDGETLFDIAYECGVSVDELVRLNPQIRRPDTLEAGECVNLC